MTTTLYPSITDEQLAELGGVLSAAPDDYPNIIVMRALFMRLRAAEQDAARYRWLREFIDQSPQAIEYLPCSDGDLIDEVIDQAIQQSATR